MSAHRFSTNDLPVALRREVAEAAYSAHLSGAIDFPSEHPLTAELVLRPVADIQMAAIDISPVRFITPHGQGDMLYLGLTLAGGGRMSEAGKEPILAQAGDICAMRGELDYDCRAELPSRFLNLALPYARVLPKIAGGHDGITLSVSGNSPAARLLRGYASAVIAEEHAFSPGEEAVIAEHLADLIALLFGASRDGIEQARRGGVRVARRHAIEADIRANLGNAALSIGWLVRRHALSASYIRSLFYDEETNFTDFVTAARLDRVAAALRDPATAHRTIAALALSAGFGDVSWFNQVFRRRFGVTPSDMRAGRHAPAPARSPTRALTVPKP